MDKVMKFVTFVFLFCAYFHLVSVKLVLADELSNEPPHIIFIVADDLGWNDIGFHNPEIISPNLDKLATTGVILDQYYVQFLCTPSRNAFMTGCYPFRTGMQHDILETLIPAGIPLKFPFLPEKLRQLGYATHMVGKWHVGFCNVSYTPTFRGFDSFLGYYTGSETYFTHEVIDASGKYLDFRNNTAPERNYNGTYSTFLFRDEAVNIVEAHNSSRPLFMYLPFQAVHAPLQVPDEYIEMYSHIKDASRRNYSAMVTALDDAVGNITAALKDTNLYEKTIIIFTTDNGGQTLYGGNNFPLRGNKNTLWEGGTRGVAFVHSPLLNKTNYINKSLIHAVDWFSTIMSLAGRGHSNMNISQNAVDGIDQWATISEDVQNTRTEFVYNIDNYETLFNAAIRIGDYKLIVGDPGLPDGWIPPKNVLASLNKTKWMKSWNPQQMLLYNLADDPTEHMNLAKTMSSKVTDMWQVLMQYASQAVPPFRPHPDPAGLPSNWGGVYSPGWCLAV